MVAASLRRAGGGRSLNTHRIPSGEDTLLIRTLHQVKRRCKAFRINTAPAERLEEADYLSKIGTRLEEAENLNKIGTRSAILLYKNDLRVDDHPGLHMAASEQVLPLYCLDPELVYSYAHIPGGVELLWGALTSLQDSLRNLGSDLLFKTGPLAEVLVETLQLTGATTVIMESEVDFKWRSEIDKVRCLVDKVTFKEWTSTLRPNEAYLEDYREMKKLYWWQIDSKPLDPVQYQFRNFVALTTERIPDLEDFRDALRATDSVKQEGRKRSDLFNRQEFGKWAAWSAELTKSSETPVMLLREYLSGQPCSSLLLELKMQSEEKSMPGISFAPLFSLAMGLGVLSPRRVCYEARKMEPIALVRNPFFAYAISTGESYDFHHQIARRIVKDGCASAPGSSTKRFWRWEGIITEYCIAFPENGISKGSIVLVHGFGATCMHWRRNVDFFKAAGYTVYCPSIPGFGRTQKLYMKYSRDTWNEYMTSFLTDVVQEPAVVVGNSIGAYTVANAAALHPELVSAVILINPAGKIDADYVPGEEAKEPSRPPPPAPVIDLLSKSILLYLQITVGSILRNAYPMNKANADAPFLAEMRRASRDPNTIAVMKSPYFFTQPPPLNYILSEVYKGRVLLLQGVHDPLSKNGVERARQIGQVCNNVSVKTIEAGHCGHDEVPDLINAEIKDFIDRIYSLN